MSRELVVQNVFAVELSQFSHELGLVSDRLLQGQRGASSETWIQYPDEVCKIML